MTYDDWKTTDHAEAEIPAIERAIYKQECELYEAFERAAMPLNKHRFDAQAVPAESADDPPRITIEACGDTDAVFELLERFCAAHRKGESR